MDVSLSLWNAWKKSASKEDYLKARNQAKRALLEARKSWGNEVPRCLLKEREGVSCD